eukprot:COSAG01_NODE_1348_length_10618_cov_34.156164_4_plen_111_part_00
MDRVAGENSGLQFYVLRDSSYFIVGGQRTSVADLFILLVRVVAVIAVGAVLIGVVILRDSCHVNLEALQLVPIKHYGRDPERVGCHSSLCYRDSGTAASCQPRLGRSHYA